MQPPLPGIQVVPDANTGASVNRLASDDRAFHDWYRFVLSFPPHLVRDYLREFGNDGQAVILDPFCGTGTTLVEAKLAGLASLGLEANPFAHFASSVKTDWSVDPDALLAAAYDIAAAVRERFAAEGINDNRLQLSAPDGLALKTLDPESARLLIKDSISPLPLHKALTLREAIEAYHDASFYKHLLLAFANTAVGSISNLRFGPEVGVDRIKTDAAVVGPWLNEIGRMVNDLRLVAGNHYPAAEAYLTDARQASAVLAPESVDAVITSPPYPNEKDYTRTTRLESVLLGLIHDAQELKTFKGTLVRSNTRGVYKGDDDDQWVAHHVEIQRIAEQIEQRRIELGKTSGFERLYSRVTRLYFGGMARHLAELRGVLRPGARLAYVVGDQASYLRVMIRTGQLLAEIAQELGYELVRIDLFRTRFATATKEQLREEVIVLRWPG
jgi:DNA modification methylase